MSSGHDRRRGRSLSLGLRGHDMNGFISLVDDIVFGDIKARHQLVGHALPIGRVPGIGGLEATRRIRALPPPFGQVPILALTASAFPEQVAECLAAGMDGHVAKPVDRRGLARAIACALRKTDLRAAAPPPQEPPAPRLDRGMLEETLRYIPRTELHASLQALRARQAAMQHLLAEAAAPEVVAEAAHQLGALAGMFGFTALSRLSCSYEREVACGGPTRARAVARLGRQLQTETGAALALLDQVSAETAAPP